MKKIVRYECEYCHMIYDNREDAEQCECFHKVPDYIESYRFKPMKLDANGYPDAIVIRFSNGQSKEYRK